LSSGHTTHCGCKEEHKHGDATGGRVTPEYISWRAMLRRCSDPKHERFKHYGGRGIKVCERWRESYVAFLADMGRRPSPKHSIDRIDGDGDYEPSNCRWATRSEQERNKKRAA